MCKIRLPRHAPGNFLVWHAYLNAPTTIWSSLLSISLLKDQLRQKFTSFENFISVWLKRLGGAKYDTWNIGVHAASDQRKLPISKPKSQEARLLWPWGSSVAAGRLVRRKLVASDCGWHGRSVQFSWLAGWPTGLAAMSLPNCWLVQRCLLWSYFKLFWLINQVFRRATSHVPVALVVPAACSE